MPFSKNVAVDLSLSLSLFKPTANRLDLDLHGPLKHTGQHLIPGVLPAIHDLLAIDPSPRSEEGRDLL
jgi:hypothetical protein